MNKVCIYLRKSRADEEIEKALGQGETLRKHRKALLKFAKENNLNIVDIKEEIVSGDSLFFRPKMLELLKEVEEKKYTGVLVMDIDRLGRGGMKDQGIILDAFKESNTEIITPTKTYNLNNEFDEEMTEFKTFFARRELKSITKRMQGGRVRSVEDGNYIGTNPPLGYEIFYIQKSRTLKIVQEEAEIIKIIFKMYSENNGATSIAEHLNMLCLKTKTGNKFSPSSVLAILKNPVYIGKITWKKREEKKSKIPGKTKDCRTRDKSEWIISQGKHEAIISEDLFNKCQDILTGRYHIPYQLHNKPVNPFSGLITCKICGKKMTMRPSRGINRLMCVHKCGNRSSRFDYVESDLIKGLEEYVSNYKIQIEIKEKNVDLGLYKKQATLITNELNELKKQKNKLFDLLERGIYDEMIFLERSKNIDKRIEECERSLSKINEELSLSNLKTEENIVNFKNAIETYKETDDIDSKNLILKSILEKVEYFKDKEAKNDDFELTIYPKFLR